jgi:hypothetical protein
MTFKSSDPSKLLLEENPDFRDKLKPLVKLDFVRLAALPVGQELIVYKYYTFQVDDQTYCNIVQKYAKFREFNEVSVVLNCEVTKEIYFNTSMSIRQSDLREFGGDLEIYLDSTPNNSRRYSFS